MSIGSILSIESIEQNVQNYVHSTISFHDWVIDCSTGQRGGKRGHPWGKHQAKRERKGCKGGGGREGRQKKGPGEGGEKKTKGGKKRRRWSSLLPMILFVSIGPVWMETMETLKIYGQWTTLPN